MTHRRMQEKQNNWVEVEILVLGVFPEVCIHRSCLVMGAKRGSRRQNRIEPPVRSPY